MMKLELDDSRRLTGKGLLWDEPGAVIDAFVSGVDKTRVVSCWQKYARRLLDVVGWQAQKTTSRIFEDGVTVALSAPFDALYAACELNEAAWELACSELRETRHDEGSLPPETVIRLRELIAEEVNPALLALIDKAEQLKLPWLTDDDEFSLGFGATTEVWPVDALPAPDSLDWSQYRPVPVALVTGTNGKSTSVRLTSEMVARARLCAGVTSTDFIRVGEHIIDRGDYSGPGGARTLLRHPDVDVALLEVARGGILRRGLPLPLVDAALITNVAEDHLGQYGINTLQDLAATKFVVAKAVKKDGMLVLNADDSEVVRLGERSGNNKCWFSLDADNPLIRAQQASGGACCFVEKGQMVYQDSHGAVNIVAVDEVPMTFNGAASHNVQNALGAIGLAKALGLADADIADALKAFKSDVDDNPGRGNLFQVNGATVVMDFAHNEHSMAAIVATANNLPSKRKWLMMSSAGDRSDKDIRVMTEAALALNPDKLVVAELLDYLRGRAAGEIPALVGEIARSQGIRDEDIFTTDSPLAAAELILAQLQRGDLALLLVLSERDKVVELIRHNQD